MSCRLSRSPSPKRYSQKYQQEEHSYEHTPMTFMGIHSWYKRMFEKLGWTVISEDPEKKEWYKKSIHRLMREIEIKMSQVEENDRKMDLEIMYQNAKKLKQFVMETL